jgi:ADP-ribose pyrophosphatase
MHGKDGMTGIPRYSVKEKRELFHGRIFSVTLDSIEFDDGTKATMEVVRHGGAAAVVPLTEAGRVILVRQFRYSVNGALWEIPAGRTDAQEDTRACAARELEEETGFRAASIEKIGSILTTPGFSDERIDIFLARELTQTQMSLDPDEFIDVVSFPCAAALGMIDRGEIEDAKSIVALLLAARRLSWTAQ